MKLNQVVRGAFHGSAVAVVFLAARTAVGAANSSSSVAPSTVTLAERRTQDFGPPVEVRIHSGRRVRVPTGPLESAPGDSATRGASAPSEPSEPYSVSAARMPTITRGRFTSVQVNVNAGGNDILNDAANEPSIAVDPTDHNRMAIGWRQFDTIANNFREGGFAYTTDGGATWTFPGVLEEGVFRSDPVLSSDSSGRFFYSSLSSVTSAEVFRSINGGQTWPLEVSAFGGDKQWMIADRTGGMGDGHIYQIWNVQFSCCGAADFTRSTDGGLTYEGPFALPAPSLKWGTLDVDANGMLYAAGAELDQSGHLIARSSNARDAGQTPTFDFVHSIDLGGFTTFGAGPNPGGLLGQVGIGVDRSNTALRGNVYVLGSVLPTAGGDPLDVHFIRSEDGGATFSSHLRVNDDVAGTNAYQWFGTIGVAPNGRIDAIWNDTRNDPNPEFPATSELFYSYSLDGGVTWSPNEPVSPAFNPSLGYPQQNKLGDYYHMVSDNGGADLAWAATFTGGQNVYYVRLTPDCNGNGVADATDITTSFSDDCNGDLIPDECHLFIDCNNNTVLDLCDVAGGTSEDCNENQVPDECEPNLDCNNNSVQDICDVFAGTSPDCNLNVVPDECELGDDCNENLIPDECDIAGPLSEDCNGNSVPDECDIASGTSQDVNGDDIPDECSGACCVCDACTIETPGSCASASGAYYGDGSTCEGFTCPNPDTCATALRLPSEPSVHVPFSVVCSGSSTPGTVPCESGNQPFGADVWYTFVSPCCGTATFSLCDGTTFDTVLAVYGGGTACTCPTNNSTLIGTCGDDTCGFGGGPSVVSVSAQTNHCYTVRVAGWNGAFGGGALDVTVACNPNSCAPTDAPGDEIAGVAKNRYITLVGANAGVNTALRVTLDSVPSPFGAFAGQTRWVGAPSDFADTVSPLTTFRAAPLACAPVFRDWSADGVVHVHGDGIVPGATYRIQAIRSGCVATDDCAYSSPVPRGTQAWGDVRPPFRGDGGLQPDFLDISAVVGKFQQLPGAIPVVQADIAPDAANQTVNFQDISGAVTGFQGFPYPFDGPSSCP